MRLHQTVASRLEQLTHPVDGCLEVFVRQEVDSRASPYGYEVAGCHNPLAVGREELGLPDAVREPKHDLRCKNEWNRRERVRAAPYTSCRVGELNSALLYGIPELATEILVFLLKASAL